VIYSQEALLRGLKNTLNVMPAKAGIQEKKHKYSKFLKLKA
jgi:hypothetical protein